MLKRSIIGLVSILAMSAVVAFADSKDDIKGALQKVTDSSSYSWTTNVEGGMMRGTTQGKQDKDGTIWLSMQFRDSTFEIIIKGDKIAVKTDDGWKSSGELMEGADDAGGPPPPERFAAMIAQNFKAPVAQATENLDSLQNIQKTDSGFSADLSEDAAKKLLMFRRRRNATTNPDDNNAAPQIDVSNAKATVGLKIGDSGLTQIQLHSTGTISFNGNDRDIDRTTTTDISNVGSTTIDIPAEAKAKLQ
jgi:hypothetical protein